MYGPVHMFCGRECGPWCCCHMGPQGSCQSPSAWPGVKGLVLASEAGWAHIKGSRSLIPVGWNNLMRVQEGGCGWWRVGGGASLCPGQLPGSTAKYLGSAYVLGRGEAVLGAWPCFPLSPYNRRAASESWLGDHISVDSWIEEGSKE